MHRICALDRRDDDSGVGVVGRGRMGRALSAAISAAGHRVVSVASRDELDTRQGHDARHRLRSCELVLLAVPFGSLPALAASRLAAIGSDQVLVDMSNPLIESFYDASATPGPGRCGAETVASLFPRTPVVKAFNTLPADMVHRPVLDGRPVVVPVAGDDEAAKRSVANLIVDLGYDWVDAGPLSAGSALEGLALTLFLLRRNGPSQVGLRVAALS